MYLHPTLRALAALVTLAQAQSLVVVNQCDEDVFLYTQSSFGSNVNDVTVAAAIVPTWVASVPIGMAPSMPVDRRSRSPMPRFLFIMMTAGTECDGSGSCTTGSEFNFYAISGSVTYDISLIYEYNITTLEWRSPRLMVDADAFACTISSGCLVSGPDGSCYSPCCSSVASYSGGAFPAGGGGYQGNTNTGPGPYSSFYYNTCYNTYPFPDYNGASLNGWTPADLIVYTCPNTTITLKLCPGTTSHYQ